MAKTVLIDSGCIVAALHRRDQHHAWAREFRGLYRPVRNVRSGVIRKFFPLGTGPQALCTLLERKIISVGFSLQDEVTGILRLLRRYDDTPMSLADACLVRMAELIDDSVIFTTDSDFRTYRKHGRQIIPIITPY